jgi:hypothetical protein
MRLIPINPLIPAKAGTQILWLGAAGSGADLRRTPRFVIWVPACAGMSGVG